MLIVKYDDYRRSHSHQDYSMSYENSNVLRDVQRQYVTLVAAVEAVEAVNLKSP